MRTIYTKQKRNKQVEKIHKWREKEEFRTERKLKYEDELMPSARDHIEKRNQFDIRCECKFWLVINYKSVREKNRVSVSLHTYFNGWIVATFKMANKCPNY